MLAESMAGRSHVNLPAAYRPDRTGVLTKN
jgi:hypothetical protein